MKSLKKLLLISTIVFLICGMMSVNYASSIDDIINQTAINNNTANDNSNKNNNNNSNTDANANKNTNKDANKNTNTNTNTTTTGNKNANANKNTNVNTNTSLPKTGADDTVMWVVAISCVCIAIYTYKKIRDYNV